MVINMKYLKTVILENFQSHKYSSIDFDEALNIIIGPSDSGKTAIIRGIKWVLYNEPLGDFFIRQGENEASVTLVFSDNTKVKRLRSKSKNLYILYKKNGEEIRFEGFGLNIPEEIIEEIGIRKIELDSNETNTINIAEQLEGPFLLSEKPSTRAMAIGRLIGVNIIDDALKETLRDIRNLSINRRITENKIFKTENELKEYDYLYELELKLKKAEEIRKILCEKSNRHEKLISFNRMYDELNIELKTINMQLINLEHIEEINPLLQHIEKDINNLKYLNIKKIQFIDNQDEIKSSTTLLNKLAKIDDVSEMINKLNSLFIIINRYQNIKNSIDRIIKEINITKIITIRLDKLPEVEKAISSFERKPIMISKLTRLSSDYNLNQNNLAAGMEFIKKFDGLETSELLLESIINKAERLRKVQELTEKFKGIKVNSEIEKKNLIKLNKEINVHLNRYKELLSELEVCPLCLSNIDSNKIEYIISHYN